MTGNFSSAAVITEAKTLADKTYRLKVDLPELQPEDAARLFSLSGSEGWFLFAPARQRPEDITVPKEELAHVKERKSPGERLRATLYVLWENSTTTLSFEQFYTEKMERFIEGVKAKLPKND